MLEHSQKHLRTLNRDYWLRAPSRSPSSTLRREMMMSGAIMVATCGALALGFPALAPALLLFGALTMPCMFAVRLHEIRKEMKKVSMAELALCGQEGGTFTISGPSRAVNVIVNTQAMVNRLTMPSRDRVFPADVIDKLAPYFNDCAEAAAQLDAAVAGKAVDQFPLSRPRMDYDDHYGVTSWCDEVKLLQSRSGTAKKQAAEQAAERIAATTAAVSQVQDGIGSSLTVKRIRLKVAA